MIVEIVSATTLGEQRFWQEAPLAVHLDRAARDERMRCQLTFENSEGLPAIYNRRIQDNAEADALVFIHDDVWIEDFFFLDRVVQGLKVFDLIGVAGTARRSPRQVKWAYSPVTMEPDRPHLRGAVGHGPNPFGPIDFFGATPADCELVDGLFIAAKKSSLRNANVQFDPRFSFHFYDLDICRAARAANLRVGVWPIGLTHRSNPGEVRGYGSTAWEAAKSAYLDKWGD